MEKILPVVIDTGIQTECWNYYRLAAMLSDDRYLPWFIERFIELTMFNGYEVNYYDVNSMDYVSPEYDEVIYYEDILTNENIVETVIDGISKSGYIMLYADCYYIEGSRFYKDKHYYHELMIIGFNDELREFTYVSININSEFWGKYKISFSSLEQAYASAIQWLSGSRDMSLLISDYHYPACIFFLRDIKKRRVQLTRICGSLKRLLFGEIRNISYHKLPSSDTENIVCKGVSIYKRYYESLYSLLMKDGNGILIQDVRVFVGLKKLSESKVGLLYRLKYLDENKYIVLDRHLVDKLNKLCEHIATALRLIEKFMVTENKELLPRMADNLRKAESIDIELLEELIRHFEDAIFKQRF